MNGKQTPFGSAKCVSDIQKRIEDATENRNLCAPRTDSRSHYNGLLGILRRKLRSALKTHSA